MVALTIYVEGGGVSNDLRTACRKGFSKLLERSGLAGRMPTVFASGSRSEAFDDFRTALGRGKAAVLLVDSEDAPTSADPWAHVAARPGDNWKKPEDAHPCDLQLMVRATEAWLVADAAACAEHFGKGFDPGALPKRPIEEVARAELVSALSKAAKGTKKAGYEKGRDTFAILATVAPDKLRQASAWADRFFDEIHARMAAA